MENRPLLNASSSLYVKRLRQVQIHAAEVQRQLLVLRRDATDERAKSRLEALASESHRLVLELDELEREWLTEYEEFVMVVAYAA
jgi:hypothetical protein